MDKNIFKEHLNAYIDGELSGNQSKEFEQILASTPEIREEFDSISKLVDDVRSMPRLKTSDDFMFNLNNKLQESKKSSNYLSLFFEKYIVNSRKPILAISMSFVFLIAISSIYKSSDSKNLITSDQDSNQSIYFSDVDSTEVDVYEDDIQLTSGSE